jgi:iron(III) transport system permease protein
VVLAIAFILLFARPLPLVGISLSGTLTIIFLAYLARFLTVCLKPVHNSMLQLDPAMEEAASLAGAIFAASAPYCVAAAGPRRICRGAAGLSDRRQ